MRILLLESILVSLDRERKKEKEIRTAKIEQACSKDINSLRMS